MTRPCSYTRYQKITTLTQRYTRTKTAFSHLIIRTTMDTLLDEINIAEQISINETVRFPTVFAPKKDQLSTLDATVAFLDEHRDEILARLLHCGAILFRGFPMPDATAFDAFARAFKWQALPYVGGAAPRTQVTSIVFTSNESPPSQPIPFHHEMAQVPKFPEHLMFFCEKPAKAGGETPIAYSPMIYERIRNALPAFVQKLEDKQVRYTRILPNGDDPNSAIGRGWQSTYLTQDRQHAEQVCRDQGTGNDDSFYSSTHDHDLLQIPNGYPMDV
jgi:hypothetical protein